MKLARLNSSGQAQFREYLGALATGVIREPPLHLLEHPDFTEPLPQTVEVERRLFGSRYAAAEYLNGLFRAVGLTALEKDIGLWAWLSLFYFNELCPSDAERRRRPGAMVRWFLDASGRRYYRHLLAGPFFVYRQHLDNPGRTRVLLFGPLHKVNGVYDLIAGRMRLVSNPAVVECVSRLYFDARKGHLKRNAQTSRPGGIKRFVSVIMQFDCTYDLYSMSPEAIMALLPAEFRQGGRPAGRGKVPTPEQVVDPGRVLSYEEKDKG